MVSPVRAALRSCTRCGLCLADCPTYLATGLEAESPRGRVQALGLGVADPTAPQTDFAGFWGCLSCGVCGDVCPTGVDVVEAYRNVRLRRPESTADRIRMLLQSAHYQSEDPAVAVTARAALRRADTVPPTADMDWGSGNLLVTSDLLTVADAERIREVVRGFGLDVELGSREHLSGATGLLLDAGLGSLHQEYVAVFRAACRQAPPSSRLVAVDAEAWRLAELASACGVPMVTLPALIAEAARPGSCADAGVLSDFGLGEDPWREPMRMLSGRTWEGPPAHLRAVSGPLVLEERALPVLGGMVAELRNALDGASMLTADFRSLARFPSAVFYLDLIRPPSSTRT